MIDCNCEACKKLKELRKAREEKLVASGAKQHFTQRQAREKIRYDDQTNLLANQPINLN